jgi:hypothetical protein
MRYAWTTARGPVEQTVTFAAIPGSSSVATFVATTAADHVASAALIFGKILASVEFDLSANVSQPRDTPAAAPLSDEVALPAIPMPGMRTARAR